MLCKAPLYVLMFALAGCGPRIKVTQDVAIAVGRDLQTYAFVKDTDDLSPDRRAINDRLRALLKAELDDKGYRQVTSGQPDFLVGQFAASVFSLEEVEDTDELARRLEQRQARTGDVQIDQSFNFEDARLSGHGTLLVYMADPDSKEVLWRSRAETDLSFEGQGAEQMEKAIELIMADFPSR